MPDEPDNRKIEELLKAYARKRGEQSGGKFDVHPAVRKMLQGEVSRQYPAAPPETKSWLKWVFLFWPRLAFGAAAVALLSAVLWNVSQNPNPSERDMKLAKADKEPAKRQNAPVESFGEPQPATAPTASEAVRRKQSAGSEGLRGLGLESDLRRDDSGVVQERLLAENESAPKEPKAAVEGGSVTRAVKPEDRMVRLRSAQESADSKKNSPATPAPGTLKDLDGESLSQVDKTRGAGAARDVTGGANKKESETVVAGLGDKNDGVAFSVTTPAPKPTGAAGPSPTPTKPAATLFDDALKAPADLPQIAARSEPAAAAPGTQSSSKLSVASGRSRAGGSLAAPSAQTATPPAGVPALGFQVQGVDAIAPQSWAAADSFALASTNSTARFYNFAFGAVPLQQRALVRFVNGRAQSDAPKTAPKDALEEKSKGIEDGFVRVEPLSSVFDVEQTDSQIKIIDSDGSIYTGAVLISKDEKQRGETETDFYKYKKSDLSALAQPVAPITFTASGTNQRLGKIVVINATLLSSEPPAVAYNGVAGEKTSLVREQKVEQLSETEARTGVLAKRAAVTNVNATIMGRQTSDVLRAQRIQGTVRVGGTNEMRLDATRQSP